MLDRLRSTLAREQRLLLSFLAVLGLASAFAGLAGEMIEGETTAFDRDVTYLFRLSDHATPIGAPWLPDAVRDLTALGSVSVLTLVIFLAVAFCFTRGHWRQGLLIAAATGGGALASKALKLFYARPRPEIVPHLVPVHTLSFPSGHATNSAIVYLTLTMILARGFEERATRVFIITAGLVLTVLVGITRVYLGVHYPSDVIAGWTAGAAWALAMSALARRLQAKHKIEPPEPETEPNAS